MKIVQPNVIQVWDKLEFDTSKEQLLELKKRQKKIEPNSINKDEEKLIVLQEIDCINKTHKVIRSIFYKTEYNPYEEPIDIKNTIPTNITDRSTNMTLLEKVCTKEKMEEIIREQEKGEPLREQEEKEHIIKQQESKRIKEQTREEESKKRSDENWNRYKREQEEKKQIKKQKEKKEHKSNLLNDFIESLTPNKN